MTLQFFKFFQNRSSIYFRIVLSKQKISFNHSCYFFGKMSSAEKNLPFIFIYMETVKRSKFYLLISQWYVFDF